MLSQVLNDNGEQKKTGNHSEVHSRAGSTRTEHHYLISVASGQMG